MKTCKQIVNTVRKNKRNIYESLVKDHKDKMDFINNASEGTFLKDYYVYRSAKFYIICIRTYGEIPTLAIDLEQKCLYYELGIPKNMNVASLMEREMVDTSSMQEECSETFQLETSPDVFEDSVEPIDGFLELPKDIDQTSQMKQLHGKSMTFVFIKRLKSVLRYQIIE